MIEDPSQGDPVVLRVLARQLHAASTDSCARVMLASPAHQAQLPCSRSSSRAQPAKDGEQNESPRW